MRDLARKYPPRPHVDLSDRRWPNASLTQAPIWCSVDLRDGNQALIEPMGLMDKLVLFDLLVDLGFKEIEVAFPSASEIEFAFVRDLIEQGRVPADVSVQALTQARDHLIRRTFESLRGAPTEGPGRPIVHLYNSTSPAQRRVVFGMTEDQIVEVAVAGVRLIKELSRSQPVRLEYSPESFTSTELPFALRICEAVMNEWGPTPEDPIILNLPATVEVATPNVYADQIEWMCRHLPSRDSVIVSVHTHNDRGCAIAAAELAQMAGADRVEGTILGYGERTGNVDLVTLALNLLSHGVDPKLDLKNVSRVIETVHLVTDEPIHPRHPYVGDLVYTAFSGSHQDAINKGLRARKEDDPWDVPYLLIDPRDIGREYEGIIRVNSQSGKGGVAYILRLQRGLDLPKAMQPEFAKIIQSRAESKGGEISPSEIVGAFESTYLNPGAMRLVSFRVDEELATPVRGHLRIEKSGETLQADGEGSGSLEAFLNALVTLGAPPMKIVSFHEHSVEEGTDAQAAAYVQVESAGRTVWGAGLDANSGLASLRAALSAANRLA